MQHIRSMRAPSALALILVLTLGACGGDAPAPAKASKSKAVQQSTQKVEAPAEVPTGKPAAASQPATEKELGDGPRVTFGGQGGSASFKGTPPSLPPLPIKQELVPDCDHTGAGVDSVDPSIQISASGGLANVVIEVMVKGAPAPAPLEKVVLDQAQCRFEPHVMLIPAGSQVEYANSDVISHNVNVIPRVNDAMNVMVGKGMTASATYPKKDQIRVECDLHAWMGCWIYVSDASFSALSDKNGAFALPGLPEGSHAVSCWHESLGSAKGSIVVGPGGVIEALELPLGKITRR